LPALLPVSLKRTKVDPAVVNEQRGDRKK